MEAWVSYLKELEKIFGKKSVEEWVRPLKISRFDARNLYLEAENPLQVNWFEEQVRPHLKNTFFNNNGVPIQVHIQSLKKKNSQIPFDKIPVVKIEPDPLNAEKTLSNFFPDNSFKLSMNILQELLFKNDNSLQSNPLNPIYIYGPEGSGKTHILMAMASLLKKQKKVFFVSAETFASHVVTAIRLGQMEKFRKTYRAVDALIIDDIHRLAKKHATQEEFFHTYNHLHQLGKPIILSAPFPPSQLMDIEPRLISRFEWGLILKIDSPSPELMKKILENRSQELGIEFDEDVFQYFVKNFSLKATFELFDLFKTRIQPFPFEKKFNLPRVEYFLKDQMDLKNIKVQIDDQKILRLVSEHYGIKIEDVLGRSHAKHFVKPRQLAMYILRKLLRIPFIKIGEIFNRDHSTVMSSVRLVEKQLESKDSTFSTHYREIAKALKI